MPTYTYACTECDEQLEVVQTFTADPLTECPRCHGRLRKVFHPVGVVFKGSGFYRTDSRSGTSTSKQPAGKGSGSSDSTTEKSAGPDTKSGTTSTQKSGTGEGAGTGGASGSSGTATGSGSASGSGSATPATS